MLNTINPCPIIECPGSDLLTNYTSEGEEPFPPFISVDYDVTTEPPIDKLWERQGCLFLCKSYISQDDADLCALRQSLLCTDEPPNDVWYSAPACCTVPCPDGTTFTYCVPAGMFVARTYQEAYDQALAYACEKALELRICLAQPPGGGGDDSAEIGVLPRCSCVGVAYSGTIIATGTGAVGLTWSVLGMIPPGLTFQGFTDRAVISGTPTANGTYAFIVTATTPLGNYASKTVTIQVLEITTTALPDFTVGVPYSFQLAASGGTGNYNFRVSTGTLPDGLDLSATGLISGTPTGLTLGGAVTFEVIDLTCESAQKTFYTPRISMATIGHTTIKTYRGWPEYTPDTGALYKRLDVTGEITQRGTTIAGFGDGVPEVGGRFAAGAKYIYSGASIIDINGNLIQKHNKDLSVACDKSIFIPALRAPVFVSPSEFTWGFVQVGVYSVLGYCWEQDPNSCAQCVDDPDNWQFIANNAVATEFDYPQNMVAGSGSSYITQTPTSIHYTGTAFKDGVITDGTYDENGQIEDIVTNFPKIVHSPLIAQSYPWIRMTSVGDYTLTLSNPFTESDANASAVSYTNNSRMAENTPNYLSWWFDYRFNRSSRATSVQYVLTMTNLVPGEDYIARVQLVSSNGAISFVSIPFTAVGNTYTHIGSVPTPAPGFTITVKNPAIVFA